MTRKQGIGVDEKSPRGTGWGVLAVLTVGEVFVRKLMVWKTRKKAETCVISLQVVMIVPGGGKRERSGSGRILW